MYKEYFDEIIMQLNDLLKVMNELQDYLKKSQPNDADHTVLTEYCGQIRGRVNDINNLIQPLIENNHIFEETWDAYRIVPSAENIIFGGIEKDLDDYRLDSPEMKQTINQIADEGIQFLVYDPRSYQYPFVREDVDVRLGITESQVFLPRLGRLLGELGHYSNIPFENIEPNMLFREARQLEQSIAWVENMKQLINKIKKAFCDANEVLEDEYEFQVALENLYYQTPVSSKIASILEEND